MTTDVVEERGRIGTRLARQLDAEGKEIKFDIREDEEQNVKLQETVELLVAAGYFRARIKGLSAFDKVIGGMVWCISFCDFDIDIDLFYEENSTIGQKIKLTEKIVKVLSKMKCPFAIEPHQIQGLDFIHIFPVVQWLVKKAIRAREEVGDAVQRFAEFQYEAYYHEDVDRRSDADKARIKEIQRSISMPPKRIYKRVDSTPLSEESSRVQSTLLEYGYGNLVSKPVRSHANIEDSAEADTEGKKQVESLLAGMAQISDKTPRLSVTAIATAIDESGIREMAAKLADEFGNIRSEYGLGTSAAVKPEFTLDTLESRKSELATALAEVTTRCDQLKGRIESEKEKFSSLQSQEVELNEEIQRLEAVASAAEKSSIEAMKGLLAQREEVKKRESEFKAQCKADVTALENELAILRQRGTVLEENEAMLNDLRQKRDRAESTLSEIRLDAAAINRQIAMLQRRIDDVPSHAELNQYQRRFLELYNQIANKHKETKQFYALYNTLQDVKAYMEKEVNLLNSVYDNYHVAMQNDQNKMQFLNQLEQSLESIRQTKIRSEKKELEQRSKRDGLRDAYQELLDKQRLYYKTVKDFQEECRKNEIATTLLKEAGIDE